MRFLLSLIVSLAIFKENFSATFYAEAPEDPKDYGKCIIDGVILKKGVNNLEGCYSVTCNDDGSFEGVSCPPNVDAEGCGDPIGYVNRTADYPECCKQIYKCKGSGREYERIM